jgi:hypothetical protein
MCPQELRAAVWGWCDGVAEWINHEYAWRPTQMIPLCWPPHAHIARELPVAFQRCTAAESTSYEAIDDLAPLRAADVPRANAGPPRRAPAPPLVS